MKNLLPLMQREWLQHRFAWAMLVLVPLALACAGPGHRHHPARRRDAGHARPASWR
jgi:hypothetical protein